MRQLERYVWGSRQDAQRRPTLNTNVSETTAEAQMPRHTQMAHPHAQGREILLADGCAAVCCIDCIPRRNQSSTGADQNPRTRMRRGARYSFAEGCAEAAPRRRKHQATPRKIHPGASRRCEKRRQLSAISCQELTAYLRQ